MFLCFLQKQEKPKFVLCVTFAENGDAITGDSSGNILVWGKGALTSYSLQIKSASRVENRTLGRALTHKRLIFCVWACIDPTVCSIIRPLQSTRPLRLTE